MTGITEQAIHVGQQDTDFTATVAGQFAQLENLHEHLRVESFPSVLTGEPDLNQQRLVLVKNWRMGALLRSAQSVQQGVGA